MITKSDWGTWIGDTGEDFGEKIAIVFLVDGEKASPIKIGSISGCSTTAEQMLSLAAISPDSTLKRILVAVFDKESSVESVEAARHLTSHRELIMLLSPVKQCFLDDPTCEACQ